MTNEPNNPQDFEPMESTHPNEEVRGLLIMLKEIRNKSQCQQSLIRMLVDTLGKYGVHEYRCPATSRFSNLQCTCHIGKALSHPDLEEYVGEK